MNILELTDSEIHDNHKPNDAKTYYNSGMAYYKKQEYDKAITAFSEARKINPDYSEAYYNRGNAYWGEVDFDKAIVDYDKAIELNPGLLRS